MQAKLHKGLHCSGGGGMKAVVRVNKCFVAIILRTIKWPTCKTFVIVTAVIATPVIT